MKKIPAVWFALLLSAVASSALAAQTSTYMWVDGITGDQVSPHQGEFRLMSASTGVQTVVGALSGTTGSSAGKASVTPTKIQMHLSPAATAIFYRDLAMGTKLASVEIRLYSSTKLFYKTVFENVFLTNVAVDASDDTSEQIEFTYGRVKWFASTDPAGLTAPVQVGCWDFMLYARC